MFLTMRYLVFVSEEQGGGGTQDQHNPCCKSEEKWDACWHF